MVTKEPGLIVHCLVSYQQGVPGDQGIAGPAGVKVRPPLVQRGHPSFPTDVPWSFLINNQSSVDLTSCDLSVANRESVVTPESPDPPELRDPSEPVDPLVSPVPMVAR